MRTREYTVDNDTVTVKAEIRDGLLKAQVGEEMLEGQLLKTGSGRGIWRVGDTAYRVVAAEKDGKVWAAVNGRVYVFEDARAQDEMGGSTVAENSVAAPMPGKVIKVMVKEGDTVEVGQPVMIVEAMKMEHTLAAPVAGTVTALNCKEGEQVDAKAPLAEIEATEE